MVSWDFHPKVFADLSRWMTDSEASALGEGGGFTVPLKGGVGISFQEVFASFEDSVRDASLTEKGQAVRDGCVSG